MFDRFRTSMGHGGGAAARYLGIRALEPRFVFDGAAAPAAAQAHAEAAQGDHAEPVAHADAPDSHAVAPEPQAQAARHEVVVIDRGVADLQTLLKGVPASAEVILIDSGRDGLDQLAAALKGRSDIDAIHILSHGKPGELRLGTAELTADTIGGRYAADLAAIGDALSATGDLLIYGCDFGAGASGARAVALLAKATGADIAASDDATGDAALGGNWALERQDGPIESGVIVDAATQAAWHHLLAPATIHVSGDPVVADGAGNAVTTPRSTYYDINSNVIGATAFWANAGTVGGVNVSLRATVIAVGAADDAVSFATATGGDATVLVRAQAVDNPATNQAGSVTVRWDLVRADNPSIAVAADVDFQIGDIDGVGGNPNTRETVTPSQIGLTSYTVSGTTDLMIDTSNDRVRVSGTRDEQASPPDSVSIVRFDWSNISSWQVTYDLAANAVTGQAAFQHDGDRGLTIGNPVTKSIPKVDLDADDSGGVSGYDYRTHYTENGAGVPIADTDPLVTNTAATVQSASVTLTNAKAGDRLSVGTLPGGITASIANGSGTITVTLSGDASPAAYQAALRAVTFDSTSQNPDGTDRTLETRVVSDGVQGTSSTTTITVTAVDDAPVHGLPAGQSVMQDRALVFASANGNALTVADVDAGSGNLTTTLSVDQGDLTLAAGSGASIAGDGTGTVTITGTLTQINAALDGLTYRPATHYTGPATLSLSTNDNGNAGAGGPLTSTDSLAITVTPAPAPPVIAAPSGPQSGSEDTAIVFSSANGNAVSLSDPDSTSLTVTLASDHGALTLSRTTGLTFSAGDGAGDRTMTFTGTIADIDAALDGLRFDPDADYNGNAGITLTASDPKRPADNFTNGGFEQPGEPANSYAQVDDSAVPGWQTTASDHKIEIWTSGYNGVPAYEGSQFAEINATQVAALYQNFDAVAGSKISLDFAHRGRLGTDTMQVIVTDLGADGVYGTGDDATLLNKTYADGNTAWGAYHEELPQDASGHTLRFEFRSVSASGNDPTFGNFVDGIRISQNFESRRTIDLAIAPVADIVPDSVTTNEDQPITFNAITGTNGASADNFEDPSRFVSAVTQGAHGSVSFLPDGRLTYTPTADFNGSDSFTYTVTSGGTTETATVSVTVRPVNDAPVNHLPAGQSVAEDTPLIFSAANGNAVTVSDIDAGSGPLTVTLNAGHGTLTLGSSANVTVSGDGTGAVTLTGTLTDLNTALDGLRYQGSPDYNGPDTLTIVTDDNGNTGSGGRLTDTDALTLTVTPVNDAPTHQLPTGQSVDEDTPLTFSAGNGNAIRVRDVDAGTGSLTTTLGVGHGTLTLGSTANVMVSGNGTGTVTLSGRLADINAALDGTVYRPSANYNGPETLGITTNDNGNSGAGGPLTATDSTVLTVVPVADPPVVSGPSGPQAASEDTALVFSAANGNAVSVSDPDGGGLTLTLASDHGTLSLSRTTGLSFTSGDGTGDRTMTFSGTIADINAALDGLRFDPDADYNGASQITVTAQDSSFTTPRTIDLAIAPVADIVPDSVSTNEDQPITFNAITGTNGASADNFEDPSRFVSAVTQGAHGSVSFLPDGRLTYTPTADFNGSDSFTYTVTSGGTTETATVSVTVRPVNDAPVNHLPAGQSVAEDSPLVFSSANGNAVTVSDIDAGSGPLTVTLSAGHGTLTLGSTANVTVSGDGTGAVTLTGTLTDLNAALDGLRYQGSPDYNGPDALTIVTSDNGNTGAGGALSDTDALALTVTPVNDAPRAGTLPAFGALDRGVVDLDLGSPFSDVEGDTLAFSVAGLPPGLAIDPATGRVTGTIDRSASQGGNGGDYTVIVTADDGHGGLTSRSFLFRVLNPAPLAKDDGIVSGAGALATGSVLADNGNGPDTDPDGDPLAVIAVNGSPLGLGQSVAGSAGGRFTLQPDGRYSFDPGTAFDDLAPGQTRTTRITYTVSDSEGGRSDASLTVTVTGRIAAPAALGPSDRSARDGEPVSLPLGTLFADPDGARLTYAAAGLPPGLAIDPATGAVTGTIDRSASGPAGLHDYAVTITGTDAQGASVARTFTWRVTNPAPLAADDTATTAEDTPVTIDVLANDTDPDGDPLTLVSTGDAAPRAEHGQVAVVNGRLVYTPGANFNGTDAITYTVSDGNGGLATATVFVSVTPVDDGPSAVPLMDQFGRDGASARYDVSGAFRDPDAGPSAPQGLSFAATGLPPGLAIDPATGLISGTLPSDASAVTRYTVAVTATDAAGHAVTSSFTWTISNLAPVAAPDTATTPENTPVLVTVTANDGDPDGDAIHLVNEPGAARAAHGTVSVDPATGLLTYTPDPGFRGRDAIVYTIEDAQGERATGTLDVTVTPVNDRPSAAATLPTRNGADGESVRVPLGPAFTDPDGDALAFTATGLPPGLSIDPATGEITGRIDPAASGPTGRTTYVVTVRATDPAGLSAARSFAWTVTNPEPHAAPDAVTTAEDTAVDIDVLANDTDPDGDRLAVVPGSAIAGHGTVTLNPDGTLRYQPDPDFNGTDRILYAVSDGNGGYAAAMVAVSVTPVNDAPTVDPASPVLADRNAQDAQPVSIPAGTAFADIDAGDRLTFTATGLPPGLAIDPATGLISGTIASDASSRVPGGVYVVTLRATDAGGASALAQITFRITNPDPVAADDTVGTLEDTPVTGSVLGNDRDPDGDALHVDPVPVAGPAHGRLDLRPDGTFTYRPDPDFNGSDRFTYALVDSDGGRSIATVHLSVGAVNDAPDVQADPLTLPANTSKSGAILAVDRDGDPVRFRLVEGPSNGTLALAPDGTYRYTPYAAYSGADRFTVDVDDGHGGVTRVEVAITVTPNPVAVPPGAILPPLPPPPPAPLAPPIGAEGFILPAMAEMDKLGSVTDVILAKGAVVAAVNGIADLRGTELLPDRPAVLQETDRIAALAWQRFEDEPAGETPWFSPRPYLGRSLGFSLALDGDETGGHALGRELMVEAIRRPDSLAIAVRNLAGDPADVVGIRLLSADGGPAPGWIETDGQGGFWGRPPAGTGLVRLTVEVTLADGSLVRRPLTVDAETAEIRAAAPAEPRTEARPQPFTAQLAALAVPAAREMDLIERALARAR